MSVVSSEVLSVRDTSASWARRCLTRAAALGVVVLLQLSSPTRAFAGGALVLGVRGRRATSARRAIARATRGRIFRASFRRAVRTCRRTHCGAIVRGVIVRWHRRYLVRVRAYSSAGRYIARRSAVARTSRGIAHAAYRAARALMRAVGRAPARRRGRAQRRRRRDDGAIKIYTPKDGDGGTKRQPPPSVPPKRVAGGSGDGNGDGSSDNNSKVPSWFQRPKKRAATSGDDDDNSDALFDEPAGDGEHGAHVSLATLRTSARQRRHALISLAVGAGAMHRLQSLAINGQPQSRDADSNTAAELSLAASFYPFALLTRNVVRDIGLGVGFTRAVGAKLPLASGDEYSLEAMQLVVDMRWRWRTSNRPTAAGIEALIGWGMRDATTTPPAVLSLGYRFVRIGASGTLPLGTSLIALVAGFEARPLLSVGQQAVDALGSWSGGFGFAARAGLAGEHRSGFYYRLAFEAERYSSSFDGLDPATSPPTAGAANVVVPSQSSDTFLRFRAMVGFAL